MFNISKQHPQGYHLFLPKTVTWVLRNHSHVAVIHAIYRDVIFPSNMAARSGKDSAAPAPAGPSKDDNFVCALPTQEKSGASIGGASAAPSEKSEVSGATNAVPNRLTDTETKLKISGELPIWYNQKKSKYLKHMLHLFNTGIAMFVSTTKTTANCAKNHKQLFTLKTFSNKTWDCGVTLRPVLR